jgi:hypothetical protein
MKPIIDPRDGDIEDDASSTKRRSLVSLAGSLLVEISLPKLAVAWTLLIGLPGIILGIAPLLLSLWIGTVSWKASIILTAGAVALLRFVADLMEVFYLPDDEHDHYAMAMRNAADFFEGNASA